MTFFVDANIVVYGATSGPHHDSCEAVLRAIMEGRVDGRTSTAALEEVWHVELSKRAGELPGLATSAYSLFTPLLSVTDETFALALSLDTPEIGANDRIHVATCLQNGIATIVSADSDFDRVRAVRRVDPLDGRALAKLLRG